MNRIVRRYLTMVFACGAALATLPAAPAAQQPPPINGTIALEGTVDKTYKAANTVMVKTADGVRHLFHLSGKTVVHGGASAGAEALRGLEVGGTGRPYTADAGERTALEVDRIGGDGLKTVEGVVTHTDRAARRFRSASRTAQCRRCA